MTVRFVHATRGQAGPLVAARVSLLARARSVLVVSSRLAAPALRADLEAAGADLAHVFILDVTSHGLHPRPQDPEHEAYLPGPAMLELITKRAQQIIAAKAERPVTVLTDDVATFARYNSVDALLQIVRHAVSIRRPATDLEYVLSGGESRSLLDATHALIPEVLDILAGGDLGPCIHDLRAVA